MQAKLILSVWLNNLSEREQLVLSLTFGLNTKGLVLTPVEISKLIGAKPSNVITVREQAIDKLRSPLFKKALSHYLTKDVSN